MPRFVKSKWFRCVLAALTIFLVIAGVGWLREKRDVREIRKAFSEREAELRSKIEQVGEGVPVEEFQKLFPEVRPENNGWDWVVWIPVHYDESPSCTNIGGENKYFSGREVVRPDKFKSGGGFSHGDRFGPGGLVYYFQRAWYSSVDEVDVL